MKGKIKAYSGSVNAGLIKCTTGKLHLFSASEWKDKKLPEKNDSVVFEQDGRKVTSVSAD
jgi:hypothetical protein